MPTLSEVQSSCAFPSGDHLEQAIQRELAALAVIEVVHRSACRWLDEWSGPERVKEHLARTPRRDIGRSGSHTFCGWPNCISNERRSRSPQPGPMEP